MFINSGIIPLIVNIRTENIFNENGLIKDMITIMIIENIFVPLNYLLSIPYFIKLWYRKYVITN